MAKCDAVLRMDPFIGRVRTTMTELADHAVNQPFSLVMSADVGIDKPCYSAHTVTNR